MTDKYTMNADEPIYKITARPVTFPERLSSAGVNDLYFVDGRNLVWFGLFVSYNFSHWSDGDDPKAYFELPVVRSFRHVVGGMDPFWGYYRLLGQSDPESSSTIYVSNRRLPLETLPSGTSVNDYYFVYPDRIVWLGFTITEYESIVWQWNLRRFALEGTAGIIPPYGQMTLKEFSDRHYKSMEHIDMN